ncbi:hypothetical protein Ahy_B06g081885 isoform B [Arachis hypogaea]|uniref:Uncharacterized protein n=1 Tax=Arachis hypogaea TaxID=3818 RepID=A0A444YMA4_ARAHY|nr:hypothetical protein Ahy_B06g081885 isoform B [Arachis hypogaea]
MIQDSRCPVVLPSCGGCPRHFSNLTSKLYFHTNSSQLKKFTQWKKNTIINMNMNTIILNARHI